MGLILKELLQIAENRLTKEGCLDPRLDAELLLSFLLRTERSFFFTHSATPLDDNRCEMFFELVDRRASGEPVQYIIGTQEFMGLRFQVDERVLIPRQDTEVLVERAIEELKTVKRPMGGLEVLDLCCGSGAIAVSLAYYVPKLKITAADVSKGALDVARENAGGYAPARGIEFVQSDLFGAFPKNRKGEGKKKFDLIVTNPPYIPSEVIPTLQREVARHEPMLALDGGETGLDFYMKILAEAPCYLKKNGLLMMEIGHDQAEAVCALAQGGGGFDTEVLKDLAGHDRVVMCRLSECRK